MGNMPSFPVRGALNARPNRTVARNRSATSADEPQDSRRLSREALASAHFMDDLQDIFRPFGIFHSRETHHIRALLDRYYIERNQTRDRGAVSPHPPVPFAQFEEDSHNPNGPPVAVDRAFYFEEDHEQYDEFYNDSKTDVLLPPNSSSKQNLQLPIPFAEYDEDNHNPNGPPVSLNRAFYFETDHEKYEEFFADTTSGLPSCPTLRSKLKRKSTSSKGSNTVTTRSGRRSQAPSPSTSSHRSRSRSPSRDDDSCLRKDYERCTRTRVQDDDACSRWSGSTSCDPPVELEAPSTSKVLPISGHCSPLVDEVDERSIGRGVNEPAETTQEEEPILATPVMFSTPAATEESHCAESLLNILKRKRSEQFEPQSSVKRRRSI